MFTIMSDHDDGFTCIKIYQITHITYEQFLCHFYF